jgi:hypothetical protein
MFYLINAEKMQADIDKKYHRLKHTKIKKTWRRKK